MSWIDELLDPELRVDIADSLGGENFFVATTPKDSGDWTKDYSPQEYDTTNWGAGTVSEVGGDTPGADGQSGGIIKNALSSATGWIKDNKELSSMIGAGVAGAVKDKNAREMSQAQIDYYKQRQADINNSVHEYGQDIRKKG